MEAMALIPALLLNCIIAALELFVLTKVADKKDILKYYTYLSNAIALISSAVFAVVTCVNLCRGGITPLWLKGLRFCATYMLVTTMFVFSVILRPRNQSENLITDSDFTAGIDPRTANLLLHYLCPAISACSFLLLERQPVLTGSEWTLYGALPTIVYWSVYLLLTATNLWKDPYGLSEENPGTSSKADILLFLLIPVFSMGLDYLLWWINTLPF